MTSAVGSQRSPGSPPAIDSNGSSILMVWVKAWLLYFAVADSMLTVAVNLGLLPQFVFVPYLIDGAGRVNPLGSCRVQEGPKLL